MRQNKFKGKRIDNGEWVYGDLLQWNNNMVEILTHDTVKPLLSVSVLPETVGQFTGLYDNTKWENATEQQKAYAYQNAKINNTTPESEWKGVEIYEGDKCRFTTRTSEFTVEQGIVEYYRSAFRAMICDKDKDDCLDLSSYYELEVIGNIHEGSEE